METKKFKISSALKDLLGRELITDKYVAVFELVKNSSDAQAKSVSVEFIADNNKSCKKIIIRDDGIGMASHDIDQKWLFVGYSEKKEQRMRGTYREKLSSKRYYAGAKGVGRFSCDRLGSVMRMVTRKIGEPYNEILVNWGDFEKNSLKEFGSIPVEYRITEKSPIGSFEHGTVIEISSLRDEWDRPSMQNLKRHLIKLVNPLSAEVDGFAIDIKAEHELQKDKIENVELKRINGRIKNFLFEKLDLRTINIDVNISDDGKSITTLLTDKGQMVYSVVENNAKYKGLHGVSVKIFQLDKNAKETFSRMMGIRPINFGTIFVYKNDFRIYPFGEPGDDSLHIDHRKQQGTKRYLGSRDLIGRIVLSGEQSELHETTSRSGGFIENDVYLELINFVNEICLRRLERYVIDVLKWGYIGVESSYLDKLQKTQKITSIIQSLVDSGQLVSLRYSKDFLANFNKALESSSERLPEQLDDIANELDRKEFGRKLRAAASRMRELVVARKAADKRAAALLVENDDISRELVQKNNQVLFLSKITDVHVEYMLQCCHSIITYACTIDNWIRNYNDLKRDGAAEETAVTEIMNNIEETNKQILALSRMATKANFNATAPMVNQDIVHYFEEYIANFISVLFSSRMECICKNNDVQYLCKFSPLDIGVLIENLAFNSFKASSTKIFFDFSYVDGKLLLEVYDNGNGISSKINDYNLIFQKGYTTTDGSGLGLFQVKNYLESISSSVEYDPSYKDGFKLKIHFS